MMGGFVDAFGGGEPAADRFAVVVTLQLDTAAVQHQIELPAPEVQAGVGGHGGFPFRPSDQRKANGKAANRGVS